MSSPILVSISPVTHAATITLNRPTKGNSLTPQLQADLVAALDALARDDEVHSVILTGAGKFFCTGMDLGSGGESTKGRGEGSWDAGKAFFDAVDSFPKPTIALINGPCYGGGNGLAFACDIRIAVEKATFVLSEVKLGLVPALISKYLIREWGPSLARYAMLTSIPIPSSTLLATAAILSTHATVDLAREAADKVALAMLKCAPEAMSTVKGIVTAGVAGERERREAFLDMMRPSAEAKEGIEQWRTGKGADWIAWKRNAVRSKL